MQQHVITHESPLSFSSETMLRPDIRVAFELNDPDDIPRILFEHTVGRQLLACLRDLTIPSHHTDCLLQQPYRDNVVKAIMVYLLQSVIASDTVVVSALKDAGLGTLHARELLVHARYASTRSNSLLCAHATGRNVSSLCTPTCTPDWKRMMDRVYDIREQILFAGCSRHQAYLAASEDGVAPIKCWNVFEVALMVVDEQNRVLDVQHEKRRVQKQKQREHAEMFSVAL